MSIGWPMPGNSTVRTGLPRTRLKALGQFLAPVRAREDMHVAAESDHDLVGPFLPIPSQGATLPSRRILP